jgi:hypothetical protein
MDFTSPTSLAKEGWNGLYCKHCTRKPQPQVYAQKPRQNCKFTNVLVRNLVERAPDLGLRGPLMWHLFSLTRSYADSGEEFSVEGPWPRLLEGPWCDISFPWPDLMRILLRNLVERAPDLDSVRYVSFLPAYSLTVSSKIWTNFVRVSF